VSAADPVTVTGRLGRVFGAAARRSEIASLAAPFFGLGHGLGLGLVP
jgi:hypothetical protein